MKKLSELLKLRNKVNGLFGIEIETEGRNLPDNVPDGWTIHDDGSLRGEFPNGRAEYVLKKPLSHDMAIDAVKLLRKHMDERRAVMDFSFRTSVHVHMNVTNLTWDQYLNVLYTYLILETPLVRYCGNDRVGNRFCLRYQDAEQIGDYLKSIFREGPSSIRHLNMEGVKYAAINIAATPKYGSLEFRTMQGNMEPAYITNWLNTLARLKDYAIRMPNPQAIHDMFVGMHPSEFMEHVLKNEYQFFSYDGEVEDMRLAFSLTLNLPYIYTTAEKRREANEAEAKKREEEIREMYNREKARIDRRMNDEIREVNRMMIDEFGPDDEGYIEPADVQEVMAGNPAFQNNVRLNQALNEMRMQFAPVGPDQVIARPVRNNF